MNFDLKPLSFGEVLDGAFKIYRNNLGLFLSIAALFALPTLVPSAWLQQNQIVRGAPVPPGYFPALFLSLVFYVPLWGVTNAAAVQVVTGEPTSVKKAFARYRPIFWTSLGALLLVTIFATLWAMLLVIPGVVYYLRRSLIWPVLLIEGGTATNAMKRSRALVVGKTGGRMDRIFGASMIFAALNWVIIWGVGMLIPSGLKSTLIGTLLRLLPQFLIHPLFPIALVLIYYDARIRDEGYDLELRAKATAMAGAAPAAAASVVAGPAGPT